MRKTHKILSHWFCVLSCISVNLLTHCLADGNAISARSDRAQPKRVIAGSVTVHEPLFSTAVAAHLNEISTPEKFSEALFSHFSGVASNVTVRLSGNCVSAETRTDADGHFQFNGFVSGIYEVSAEKTRVLHGGAKEMLSAKSMINSGKSANVELCLGESFLSIKGRVVDAVGKGVSGIRITGLFEPLPEAGRYRPFSTVSDKDGSYEIARIPAPSVWTVGGWLNGGDPLTAHSLFYLQIKVESTQKGDVIRHLPLVTENLLAQARRFQETMKSANARLKTEGEILKEWPKDSIPKSQGDVIFVPDIVLKADTSAGEKQQQQKSTSSDTKQAKE